MSLHLHEAPAAPAMPGIHGTDRIAAMFGVTERTARSWCASGRIPAVMVGRRWYVSDRALAAFMEGGSHGKA